MVFSTFMIVVGLCAEWCPVCRGFEPAFHELAAEWPQARFVWLDVEDDEAVVGDIDVEDFPTLAVFRGGHPVHFGVSLPQPAVLRTLLKALAEGDPPAAPVPEAVVSLPSRIPAGPK
jgi:thioredoxin